MKILITESQFRNILDEYFNRIIESPEYDFVNRIEVIEGTTRVAGWKEKYEVPFYEYIVHAKDSDERLVYLYEKIGDIHRIMFPMNDDGTPRAHYDINTKYDF